jgi:hypothetical protein
MLAHEMPSLVGGSRSLVVRDAQKFISGYVSRRTVAEVLAVTDQQS